MTASADSCAEIKSTPAFSGVTSSGSLQERKSENFVVVVPERKAMLGVCSSGYSSSSNSSSRSSSSNSSSMSIL